jgi:hypothetical protein
LRFAAMFDGWVRTDSTSATLSCLKMTVRPRTSDINAAIALGLMRSGPNTGTWMF